MRRLLALLSLAVSVAVLAACSPQAQREWPEPAPALWEITSPDGHKAWLFGTVHSLPGGADWQTPISDAAFAQADLLVVEIANLGDTASSAEAYNRYAYTPGLGEFYGRWGIEFDAQVERVIGSSRIALNTNIEEWAAALMIAGAIRSGDPANGVDRYLLGRDKPAVSLESFDAQFAMFDALLPEDQKQMLDAVVFEESERDPSAMTQAWITGDIAGLEAMSQSGILADPELREALLVSRNQHWMEQLLPIIAADREPFIAVGAGHMLGEEGLPALFLARGHRVQRIQ